MARPERNNVDYFPFLCEEGKKMYYLEETYGNDGFAVFVKLLRELARTDYHYLDLSKKTTLMFLSAKCKVEVIVLESIINDLAELEKFDSNLWAEYRVIWCQDFIDNIQDAYKKRKNECITKKSLLDLLLSKGTLKPSKGASKYIKSSTTDSVNTHTIEEDSIKDNNIKEDKKEEYDYKKVLLSEIEISDISEKDKKYFEIAKHFQNLIIKNCEALGISTKHIIKTKGDAIDTIRLILTTDKYTIKDTQDVYVYLENEIPKEDFSWKQNILSIKTLRTKFDKLKIAANARENKRANGQSTKRNNRIDPAKGERSMQFTERDRINRLNR